MCGHGDWAWGATNGADATRFALQVARAHTGKSTALRGAQAYHGWGATWMSGAEGMTTSDADFRTPPPATTPSAWGSGAPCMLRNSTGMLRAMEAVLDCRLGETTADGQVELMRGQCNGTCELAPQLWVDGTVVGKLDSARAVTITATMWEVGAITCFRATTRLQGVNPG